MRYTSWEPRIRPIFRSRQALSRRSCRRTRWALMKSVPANTTRSWPSSAPPVNSRTRPFWVGTTQPLDSASLRTPRAEPTLSASPSIIASRPTRPLTLASQLHPELSFPRAPFRRMATALYPFSTRTCRHFCTRRSSAIRMARRRTLRRPLG